jgi:hypothetical protein
VTFCAKARAVRRQALPQKSETLVEYSQYHLR